MAVLSVHVTRVLLVSYTVLLQASRTAAQGLIGFARQGDTAAVLVEARCPSPIVAFANQDAAGRHLLCRP